MLTNTASSTTYLTTDELSQRIKYDTRTIRDRLKDSVLLEGRHYIKPFGGRKTLYIWETIEQDTRRDGSAMERLLAQHLSITPVRGLLLPVNADAAVASHADTVATPVHGGDTVFTLDEHLDGGASPTALAKGSAHIRSVADCQVTSASTCAKQARRRSAKPHRQLLT